MGHSGKETVKKISQIHHRDGELVVGEDEEECVCVRERGSA